MKEDRTDGIFKEKLGNLSGLPYGVRWNIEKGWQDFEHDYLQKNSRRIRNIRYMASAAAVMVIILSVFIFQKRTSKMLSIVNDGATVRELVLPDGNHAWLRQNSTIEYPSNFDSKQNEIKVTGEVYFEILNPSHSFLKIRVYNALILVENSCSFNIRGWEKEEHIDITPAYGAVKVRDISYEEGLTIVVPEGNYCSVHKSQNLVYSSVNTNDNFMSWKTGKLTFNNMPVATVIDILSEYYQTKIELEDEKLAFCRFSGTFSGQPIGNVMQRMQKDLDIVIRNTGNRIMISGKGCS